MSRRACTGCHRPRPLCWCLPCMYLETVKARGRAAVLRWLRAWDPTLDLAPTCDACNVTLATDGTCPDCGVAHGAPCTECTRTGYHVDTCSQTETA